MSIAVYEAAGGVAAIALPAKGAPVLVTPEVVETVHEPAVMGERTIPAVIEERNGVAVEIEPARVEAYEIEPARDWSHVVEPAVYRDETPAEMLARMIEGEMLPDLPWIRHAIVAAHPAGRHGEHWTIDWATGQITALGPTQSELKAYAAEKRWTVETGGCLDPAGRAIATDRDSQTKLLAEMVAIGAGMRLEPSGWKLQGNGFVLLTNAEMLAAIGAARAHITAAFATEATVLAGIAAGTVTTRAAIDAAAWPPNP